MKEKNTWSMQFPTSIRYNFSSLRSPCVKYSMIPMKETGAISMAFNCLMQCDGICIVSCFLSHTNVIIIILSLI